jgi:Ni,Fe-hydrogenase III small subunit
VAAKKGLSIAIFPLNMGGSNACRLELDAIFNPPYNAARYGISLTSSPKQADMILLFGSGTLKTAPAINRLLASLPDEVKLVALGSESATAAPFQGGYAVAGPIRTAEKADDELDFFHLVLPRNRKITAYIAGSPPDPQTIIDGILEAARL